MCICSSISRAYSECTQSASSRLLRRTHERECGASGANFSSLMKINVYFFLNYTYRFCLFCVHRLEHTERTQRVEIDTLALTALMISVRIAATLDVCWPQLGRSESRMLMFVRQERKAQTKNGNRKKHQQLSISRSSSNRTYLNWRHCLKWAVALPLSRCRCLPFHFYYYCYCIQHEY